MLPGDPAHVLAGAFAYEDTIAALTEKMGLDKPVLQQFFIYIGDVFRGDLGRSMFTSSNVLDDLIKRFPATFGAHHPEHHGFPGARNVPGGVLGHKTEGCRRKDFECLRHAGRLRSRTSGSR